MDAKIKGGNAVYGNQQPLTIVTVIKMMVEYI